MATAFLNTFEFDFKRFHKQKVTSKQIITRSVMFIETQTWFWYRTDKEYIVMRKSVKTPSLC